MESVKLVTVFPNKVWSVHTQQTLTTQCEGGQNTEWLKLSFKKCEKQHVFFRPVIRNNWGNPSEKAKTNYLHFRW